MAQIDLQRTSEEKKNPELNYFIAFKIDLKETDKSKIESKIKTELSKTGGSIIQRRLIELKTDILQIMCSDAEFDGISYKPNAGARKKEAANAKNFKIKETVDVIQMLCKTRKKLLKSELLIVYGAANKSAEFFTEDEFFHALDFLKGLGIVIIDNIDVKIPFDKFQRAKKLLETINKNNLYDYLGIDKGASPTEIQEKAKQVYQDSQKTSDLKKKQSGSQIDGIIKELLVDKAIRNAYDQYLLICETVWAEFSQRKDMGIKELQINEYENYTAIVMSALKVSLEEAEKILAIGCKYFQLTIIGKNDVNSFEICPYDDCEKLYLKEAKSCPHCGRPLEVLCWNCNNPTRITKEDKGCKNCGATNRAHKLLNSCTQSLDQLLRRTGVDIGELQTAFLQIKNLVPNYSTKPDSIITKRINEYNKIITDRIKQEETVGAKYKEEVVKIQQFIAKRCYQSALNIAKSLPIKYSVYNADNSKKIITDISAVIQSAQKLVDTAKQYLAQGNVVSAIGTAAKAIDICDDFSDARQIMQKYPPQSATALRVSVEKGKVRIEWNCVKQDFVLYTIIKKIGLAPINADDGSLVDRGLSVNFFEDVSVVPSTPYYYAVYAERYGVKSAVTACTTPAILFSEVINYQQEIVDGGIKVVWEAPQNVKSIEVWRNNGTVAPLKPGEGVRVNSEMTGFFDGKAVGQNAYLVVCNYEIKGQNVQSKGVQAVLKPYEKTIPLENIVFRRIENNTFAFSCAQGYKGIVKLYYAITKLSIKYNQTQKFLNFNTICKGLLPLKTLQNADGELTFTVPSGNIYQVYPIVSTEQLFIVSSPYLINTLEGIIGCSHKFINGTLTISGKVHAKAQAVIARINNENFIENLDGSDEKLTFKAEEFRTNGSIDIKLKTNTVSYVSLFVEFKENGVISYAPVVKLDSPIDYREARVVLYNIEYTACSTKPYKVSMSFESDGPVELPKMLLMQGCPKPLNKNTGKLCESIENVELKKKLFGKQFVAKVTIIVNPTATNTKFALFLNEDNAYIQMKEVRHL